MAYYTWKSYKLKVSPLDIFLSLKDRSNCFFLDSSMSSDNSQGRFSFLGADPFLVLKSNDAGCFEQLRQTLNQYQITKPILNLPFSAGAVGYLSYDLGFSLEDTVKKSSKANLGLPEAYFAFYNTILAIDNLKKTLYLLCLGIPENKYSLAKKLAEANLKKMDSFLSGVKARGIEQERYRGSPNSLSRLESDFSKGEYLSAVKSAKEYIRKGDIYQVNLSQRFHTKTRLPAYEIYRRLRKASPSSFGAYLDAKDFQILSSSPERFLKLEGDIVTTRPMKGTRPRSADKLRDNKLKAELLKSEKDKAELAMIVDLERNDLGRVCEYGSIKATKLRQLEVYSTVFQTTATITGRLAKGRDRIDLLRASFPGGSITGCPKIRSMQIIEELEPSRRSIYTGALGYLSFCGRMDFNILIRTILKKKEDLYFSVGGGIVADSSPEDEYEETLTKAKGCLEAIR